MFLRYEILPRYYQMENETQRPIRLNSATPKKQRPHWHLRFEYKLATTKLKHAVFVRPSQRTAYVNERSPEQAQTYKLMAKKVC